MTSGQTRLPGRARRSSSSRSTASAARWVSELLPHTAKIVDDIAARQDRPHQRDQPRPGLHVRHDRQRSPRQAEHRLVARLRPRQREQRPARLRRLHAARSPTAATARPSSRACGRSGFLPTQLHRRRPPRHAATRCSTCRIPPASRATTAAPCSTRSSKLNRRQLRALRRPRNPDAHRPVRDGLPHADERARPRPTSPKEPKQTLDLYGPDVTKPGTFAAQRPAGPPARRARRARRADPAPRLGPARQPARRDLGNQCNDTDQATAALVIDLKQRGLLDEHARRLGRRVRPHRLLARAR